MEVCRCEGRAIRKGIFKVAVVKLICDARVVIAVEYLDSKVVRSPRGPNEFEACRE